MPPRSRAVAPSSSSSKPDANQIFVWQTHPQYDQWKATWRLLGEVYEGDGGFLDGSNLVAHPRELSYPKTDTGDVDTTATPVERDKFKRRKSLARYENFAQAIVDLFVDHQYSQRVSRQFEGLEKSEQSKQPLMVWYQDVDGMGTAIDDWMKVSQALADVFGHIFVVIDRDPPPAGAKSAAEEGRLYLRRYLPIDAPDWLAPRHRLTAIKFVEAVERATLRESPLFSADQPLQEQAGINATSPNVQYRMWTETSWSLFDTRGGKVAGASHGFGELPVLTFYARRRAKTPVLGRSLLRDPKLFKDHYNLTSELRELIRAQTFSIFHIQLGQEEEVGEAKSRLGDHAGTDSVVFTKGGAEFIAAPDGPAATIAAQLLACERKMWRLAGISEDTDSHAPETEGSRRIKAMDLNRLLSGHALEAQRFEYALARLWYIGSYGRTAGLARWATAKLGILHPTEFFVEELAQVINDTLASLELPMGESYSVEVRTRALSKLLRDLSAEQTDTIRAEILALAKTETQTAAAQQLLADAAARAQADLAGHATPPIVQPAKGAPGPAGIGGQ